MNIYQQQRLLMKWCQSQGITPTDLTDHPQIDTVVLLIQYIQEFQEDFNQQARQNFDAVWHWVYTQRLPIKRRHRQRLINQAQGIILRRQRIQAARTRIKAQRETTQK